MSKEKVRIEIDASAFEELKKSISQLEKYFGKIEKKEKTYERGQRFDHLGSEYILVEYEFNKVALISLDSGNRWSRPVEVNSATDISSDEWEKIKDGGTFELIEK